MKITTTQPMPQKLAVYSDEQIRIDHFKNGPCTDTLVITFDPILYDWTRVPFGLEFLRKQGVDVLAVRKKEENFYQPLSRETFLQVVAPIAAQYLRVIGYGSSLGAYCALYFCSQLDCEVVAMSPRISIHPHYGVVHWQAKVLFQHTTFERLPAPRCRPIIVFDPVDFMDGVYIPQEILPAFGGAIQLRAPYSGHPSGHFLSEIGYLGRMMRAVIGGEPLPPFQRQKKVGSATYLHVLAIACAERSKPRWARSLIERSLAINPKNSITHRAKARMLFTAGELAEAKAAIDRAYELNNSDEVIKRLMAQIYLALGLNEEFTIKLPDFPLESIVEPPVAATAPSEKGGRPRLLRRLRKSRSALLALLARQGKRLRELLP